MRRYKRKQRLPASVILMFVCCAIAAYGVAPSIANTTLELLQWFGAIGQATTFTNTIDTTTPAGTDAPSVIDNRIREAKAGWQERLNVDHVFHLTGTQVSDANVGEHRIITFSGPKNTPSTVANKMFLYGKDVDSLIEAHILDESGNEIQVTSLGEILFASLSKIANNTAFSAVDFAGTGTVDLIKADVNDVAVLVDDSQTETNAAPTFTKSLTNKKYVDDQIAAIPESAFAAWTNVDSLGAAMVKDSVYQPTSDGFITFSVDSIGGGTFGYTDSSNPPATRVAGSDAIDSQEAGNFPVKSGDYFKVSTDNGSPTITIRWMSIGGGDCVKQ